MKTAALVSACFLFLVPLCSMAGTDAPSSTQESVSSGKTRSQVRAELVQAERDGWIATLRQRSYPPSDAEIQRNRDVYQARVRNAEYLHASIEER
jgi:hypothetical protein